jgi:deazaflavin-dependent oxidoreductase (nitroreductase family)
MDDTIRRALGQGHTIDITTIGRKTGQPRRIEIVFHNFDGRIYIAGAPRANRRRSWLANLEAKPAFTFHLKGAVRTDLPATATEITDEAARREILGRIARVWRRDDLDEMVRHSPLVEVHFTDATASD